LRAIFSATHTGRAKPVWQKEDCPDSGGADRIFRNLQNSIDQSAGEGRRRAISTSEVFGSCGAQQAAQAASWAAEVVDTPAAEHPGVRIAREPRRGVPHSVSSAVARWVRRRFSVSKLLHVSRPLETGFIFPNRAMPAGLCP
jgi:hypothetical protein